VALDLKIQRKLDEIKEKHNKIICFLGAIRFPICWKKFDPLKVEFLMVGGGVYKNELIKHAEDAANVYFMSSLPKKCIPDLLRQIDIIYTLVY